MTNYNLTKAKKILIKVGFFLILFFNYQNTKAQIASTHPIFTLQLNEESTDYNNLYDVSADKHGYINIVSDNGLYDYNNSILKKRKISNENIKNDFIGFYRKNDSLEFIFPYKGKLYYKENLQNLNFISGNYPKLTITMAYSISDSIILFGGFIDSYLPTILEYNVKSKKIIKKEQDINWFLNKYIRYNIIDTNTTIFDQINYKINNYSLNDVLMYNDTLLKIQNDIYLKENKKWILYLDASKHKIKGTIRKFMLNENKLYFCVANGDIGLYEFDKNKNIISKFTSDDINGFCFDNHANLWMVNSNSQILYMPKLNKKIKQYNFIDNVKIANITPINNKNSFIIKEKNNDLFIANFLNNKIHTNRIQISKNKILYIKNNTLVTKTIESLPELSKNYDHTHSTFYKKSFTLLNKNLHEDYINQFNYFIALKNFNKKYFYIGKINHLYSLKNKILLSTNNGIKYFNPYSKEIFTQIVTNSFIDSSEIKKLMFLNDSYYLLVNQNIFKLNNYNGKIKIKKSNTKFYENQIKSFSIFKQFIIGICRNEMLVFDSNLNFIFNQKLSNNISEKLIDIQATNDQLYIFTENSIFCIDSSYFTEYKNIFQIYNFNIQYDEKKVNNSSKIDLLWNNNNLLKFTFDILKSNIETKYELKFRIIKNNNTIYKEGVLKSNELYLKKLPIGDYKIQLLIQDKIKFTINISILRNWKLILLQILSIIIIIFLITFFTYLIVKRKQTKNILQLKKQLHLLEIESKTRLNQLKSHFVFNALAPLQHYIYTENKSKAINYLNTVSILIRKMLNHSRSQYILLNSEVNFINLYLKQQQIEKNFEFEFEIINEIDNPNHKIPTLFIQPILENAILHGFPNNQKGFLKIIFKEFDENLVLISITENGIGFDLKKQLLKNNNNALNIINERILILKQLPNLSNVNLETITKENSFTILLKLPLLR